MEEEGESRRESERTRGERGAGACRRISEDVRYCHFDPFYWPESTNDWVAMTALLTGS